VEKSAFNLDDSPGFLLNQAVLRLNAAHDRALAPDGLTGAQWTVLWLLATGRAQTPAAVSSYLGVDTGAITRLLDRLETKGLVARRPNPADRRSVMLALTPRGNDLYPRLPGTVAAVVARLFDGIAPEEMTTFKRVLLRVLDNADPEE